MAPSTPGPSAARRLVPLAVGVGLVLVAAASWFGLRALRGYHDPVQRSLFELAVAAEEAGTGAEAALRSAGCERVQAWDNRALLVRLGELAAAGDVARVRGGEEAFVRCRARAGATPPECAALAVALVPELGGWPPGGVGALVEGVGPDEPPVCQGVYGAGQRRLRADVRTEHRWLRRGVEGAVAQTLEQRRRYERPR